MHPSQLLSVEQQILRAGRPRLMRGQDRLLHACEPPKSKRRWARGAGLTQFSQAPAAPCRWRIGAPSSASD
ncbi:hypothetical protein ACU4HD_47020 [Cupriavidus basilensis]